MAKKKLRQVLVIPDTHHPHSHEDAYRLMLRVGSSLHGGAGPDEILILGDFADFWSVSNHDKEGDATKHLREEVDAVNLELDHLESRFPEAKITYIQGNHEWRLERYISAKAPELFGLVDCYSIFDMARRPNFHWVPYAPGQLVQVGESKLWARHEPLVGGVLPAHGTALKAGCSVIYGHDHRSQQAQVTTAAGDTHLGISVGWLGDQTSSAFSYVRGMFNWVLGFGVVTYDPTTGVFFVDAVRIIPNGDKLSCYHGGVWHELKCSK